MANVKYVVFCQPNSTPKDTQSYVKQIVFNLVLFWDWM